jgi:hypothetical protein
VRNVDERLGNPFEQRIPQFIQEKRQDNRKWKPENQGIKIQDYAVAQCLMEFRKRKNIRKIVKADPRTPPDSLQYAEALKRDHDSGERNKPENNVVQNTR